MIPIEISMNINKFNKKPQFCKNGHDTFIVGRHSNGVCKECHNAYIRQQRKLNPIKFKDYAHQRYMMNREKEKIRQYKYRQEHPEKVKEKDRKYIQANPGKRALSILKNKTNRNLRIPKFGQKGIIEFYNNCPKDMVVDHIIPLLGKEVSGLHVLNNLQYLTFRENATKYNSFDGTLENEGWRVKLQ